MEDIVTLHVKLLKRGSNEPLTGEKYSVKFYDKDILSSDDLGESTLDDFGHAAVSIVRSDYQSVDSPLEKYPDLYFTVEKNGESIYKSPVFDNQDIKASGDYSASDGWHFKLGTFIVPEH